MPDIRKGDRVRLTTGVIGTGLGLVLQVSPERGRAVVRFDGESEPREVRADALEIVEALGK